MVVNYSGGVVSTTCIGRVIEYMLNWLIQGPTSSTPHIFAKDEKIIHISCDISYSLTISCILYLVLDSPCINHISLIRMNFYSHHLE